MASVVSWNARKSVIKIPTKVTFQEIHDKKIITDLHETLNDSSKPINARASVMIDYNNRFEKLRKKGVLFNAPLFYARCLPIKSFLVGCVDKMSIILYTYYEVIGV